MDNISPLNFTWKVVKRYLRETRTHAKYTRVIYPNIPYSDFMLTQPRP